jgi:hypothetical protein
VSTTQASQTSASRFAPTKGGEHSPAGLGPLLGGCLVDKGEHRDVRDLPGQQLHDVRTATRRSRGPLPSGPDHEQPDSALAPGGCRTLDSLAQRYTPTGTTVVTVAAICADRAPAVNTVGAEPVSDHVTPTTGRAPTARPGRRGSRAPAQTGAGGATVGARDRR